jgi:hypothetical protein
MSENSKVNKFFGKTSAKLIVIFTILAVVVIALLIMNISGFSLFGTTVKTNETQTITFLEKKGEVVLVNLGVTDLYEKEHDGKFFGSLNKKIAYIKGSFEVKLGINGRDVKIDKIAEKEYEITIPKFIFIGHKNEKFETAVEKNGILSFATDDIDKAKMISEILDAEGQEKYIVQYTELLKESAEDFYSNLLPSFDKDVKLTFVYE